MTLPSSSGPAQPAALEARTAAVPSMVRGFRNRCPHCGEGRMFGRFLKTRPACAQCGLPLASHQADDLPPYLVIFLVGHVVGYLMLKTEMGYDVPLALSLTVWPFLTLILAAFLLQPTKGAVVGLQYALGMHGFAALPRPRAEAQAESGLQAREEPRRGHGDVPSPVPGP